MFARLYVMWTFLLNKQFEVMKSRKGSAERGVSGSPALGGLGKDGCREWRSQAFLLFNFHLLSVCNPSTFASNASPLKR